MRNDKVCSRTSAWADTSIWALFPVASNISGEAIAHVGRGYASSLETGHLSFSQVCDNYFDNGKSIVCLAVLEDCHALLRTACLAFTGIKNMSGIIFLSGRREDQQLHVAWGISGVTGSDNQRTLETATDLDTQHLSAARNRLRLGWDIGLWRGTNTVRPMTVQVRTVESWRSTSNSMAGAGTGLKWGPGPWAG